MTGYVPAYANALYDLAKEESMIDTVRGDLFNVSKVFEENKGYSVLLNSPTLSIDERLSLIDDAFSSTVCEYVINFLKILTERKLAHLFCECCDFFFAKYDREHNIEHVRVITAVPLLDTLTEKLKSKLESITGKTIVLHKEVEPDCLGGVILRFDSKQIDGSVRNRLDEMKKQISAVIA